MRISSKNDNHQLVCMEASEARFNPTYVAMPSITISITSELCRQMIWFKTNENTASQLRKLADEVEKHLASYHREKSVRDRISAELEAVISEN